MVFPAFVFAALLIAAPARAEVGGAAAWNAPSGAAAALRAECAPKPAADARACLLEFLKGHGAGAEALDFARLLGGEAYLKRLDERGRVDIARVRFPFRAGAEDGVLLVNGRPAAVDVAAPELASALQQDARMVRFRKTEPDAQVWASEPGNPGVKLPPEGGQRFTFALPVKTCRACERVAIAYASYDFDASGAFKGARLVGLRRMAAFSVSGQVEAGKLFEAPVDKDLTLRLEPFPEGWSVAVKDKAGRDYCAIVTPPFTGANPLVLHGADFKSPDAPRVREFRCVRSAADYDAASKALEAALWGSGPAAEAAKAEQARLVRGARQGRLKIEDLALSGLPGDERPAISSLTFAVELSD